MKFGESFSALAVFCSVVTIPNILLFVGATRIIKLRVIYPVESRNKSNGTVSLCVTCHTTTASESRREKAAAVTDCIYAYTGGLGQLATHLPIVMRSLLLDLGRLLVGIESNQGSNLNIWIINIHSAFQKAVKVHRNIQDGQLDIAAVTNAWVPSDAPNTITVHQPGYRTEMVHYYQFPQQGDDEEEEEMQSSIATICK